MTRPIRVLWSVDNVGPYHNARFRALANTGCVDLTVAEMASAQRLYPWSRPEAGDYRWWTLARDIPVENVSSHRGSALLLHALARSKADVFVGSGYSRFWAVAAAIAARMTRVVSLSTFATTELDLPRSRSKELLKSWLIRSIYDGVCCTGTRSRDYLLKLKMAPERLQVCGNVVDNGHFTKKRTDYRLELPAGPFFVTVTRFSPEKNLLWLLDAYEAYATQCQRDGDSPWPLVMCGSGPQEQAIRRRAEQLAAGEIVFPGFLGHDQLPEVYQRASCMLLPSLSEPWGLVVNESLAAGTPVLISDRCGCAPDLVRAKENGFVFTPDDMERMVELMHLMSSMSKENLSAMRARAKEIIADFSPEKWAERVVALVSSRFAAKHRGAHPSGAH